ncbi:MAG: TonB-dependent receptor [Bdellovibrionota bacterium]
MDQTLSLRQKALKINLAKRFYGTFAEIGAGQEVARHFFQAGGSSGSIAKTISAYDMTFSDHIYGKETSGRYVCESRLSKMLAKEYELLQERLSDTRGKDHQFFVFADTVAALNFKRTNEAHGWLGVRFQDSPGGEVSEVLIHVRMLDPQNVLQQDALGIVGVNLVYATLFLYRYPEAFIRSLLDHLDTSRIEVNFIRFNGKVFKDVDNRLMNLMLLQEGFTHAIMFDEAGDIVLPSDYLYKKEVLVVRGSYRPPTLVSLDMIESGKENFARDIGIKPQDIVTISEITISNLKSDDGEITKEDFLARVDLLCALGQKTLITNYPEYYKLANYFARMNVPHLGLVLGIYNFQQIFTDEYSNVEGGILSALGQLFRSYVKVYIYPYKSEKGQLETLENLHVSPVYDHLYQHLKASKHVDTILNYNKDLLHIYSSKVLSMIVANEPGWEKMVPPSVAKTINEKCLFGHPCFIGKKNADPKN